MQATRRQFLRTTLGVASLAAVGGAVTLMTGTYAAGSVRLCPVDGEIYSPGLRAFMAKARFGSPAEAMAAIRSQQVRFALELVS